METVDFVPTLCRLLGFEAPQTADGRDISRLLSGERGAVRRIGVTELPWSRSVRRGRYRYVFYPRGMFSEDYPEGFGELYDLESDPWEMENLFFDHGYRDTVAALQHELAEWLITTTRPTTVHPLPPEGGWQSVTRHNHSVNSDGKIPYRRIEEVAGGNYT